jgi:hypothetical protein
VRAVSGANQSLKPKILVSSIDGPAQSQIIDASDEVPLLSIF